MMGRARGGSSSILALAILLAAPAGAQRLKSFDDALKKGDGEKKPEKRIGRALKSADGLTLSDDDSCGSLLLDIFCETIFTGLSVTNDYAGQRRPGDTTAPALRLDGGYQRMVGGIDALSLRAEAGLRVVGLAYEHIEMREHDPPDRLTSDVAEGLLRTFGSSQFHLDWAAGYRWYTRGERHGGAQAGFDVSVRPWAAAGVEANLRWGSIADAAIADYRARLVVRPFRYPNLHATAGYRVLRAGDATLHGPEGGLSWVW